MKTAEEMLNEKSRDMICVSTETTVHEALKVMVKNRIGAILIKKEDQIIGIWTERDHMCNALEEGFNAKSAMLGDLMTTELHCAPHDATVYLLLDIFLGKRFRHLFIEKDGKYIGLLSMGDVIRASLDAKAEELQALNAMVSWDYYEDWKWKKKK